MMSPDPSALPDAPPPGRQRFSQLLQQVADDHLAERITISDLLQAMEGGPLRRCCSCSPFRTSCPRRRA
ncbi:hypothetical protein ACFSHQ_22895 [Gemmobacter lanyuensis]